MTSVSNIDTIMEVVFKNFKINQKAIPKCKIIIAEIINKYLGALQNYPSNSDQLIYAVKYLNESCYHEFEKYLNEKYPGMNIKKVPEQNISKTSPRNIELIDTPYVTPKTSPITSEKEFVPRIQPTVESTPKMIIITEAEKNALLQAQVSTNLPAEQKSPDIFSQLTNPLMWQMIEIIMNLKKQQEYSAIYTSAEVKELLKTEKKIPVKTEIIEPIVDVVYTASPKAPFIRDESTKVSKTVIVTNDEITKPTTDVEITKPTKLKDLMKTVPKIKSEEIDISKGLTKEDLPIVEKKIAALIEQKK